MDFIDLIDERNDILESDIQFLYETHPYLIDPRFINAKVIPQYPLPTGFADIVVFIGEEIVVIELKIDPIIPKYILQLNGYLEDFKKKFPSHLISGIIIGKSPKTKVNGLISSLKFKVQIKILKEDIPVHVKICKDCRLASSDENETCEHCSCKEWL